LERDKIKRKENEKKNVAIFICFFSFLKFAKLNEKQGTPLLTTKTSIHY